MENCNRKQDDNSYWQFLWGKKKYEDIQKDIKLNQR